MSAPGAFILKFTVPGEQQGVRVDRLVTEHLSDTSRSYVQRLIEGGDVLVNGFAQRPSYKVNTGDRVEVRVPPPEMPADVRPDEILIPIVYEDDDLIVFDKPAGLVVHPAPGHEHGTLVNAFKWLRPESVDPGSPRPGLVHRLDKDTSGLIVVAKTEQARLHLLKVWQEREVVKQYTALVVGGLPEDSAHVDAPIGRDPNNRKRMAVVTSGKHARSHLRTARRYDGYSLLDVTIETGRTHQIRVHCAFVGHPVAGDATYGGTVKDLDLRRQFLHARYLMFNLPGGQPLEVESPLPLDLETVRAELESRS
ncbi:MAG: RluA family pseudouridine synthase [Chloroflexia bacterium]|nr:RluA family pseudouridine synthase [Chloroflexia bacterium]